MTDVVRPAVASSAATRAPRRVGDRSVTVRDAGDGQGRRAGRLVVGLAFVAYLLAGFRLAHAGALPGDAVARVAQASATLWSRDPHLEALGFVWGPFPAALQIPLVALGGWWEPLVTRAGAAVVVSAACMAASAGVVWHWCRDVGAHRATAAAIVVAYALNPFTVLYGANGMSDAGMILLLVLAARALAGWWERGRIGDLAAAGWWLGLGYLFRYEVVAATAASAVAVMAWARTRPAAVGGPRPVAGDGPRRPVILGLVVALPTGAALLGWALASWAIVGQPFAQFSSEYGNAAQVGRSGGAIAEVAGSAAGVDRLLYFVGQLLAFGWPAVIAGLAALLLVDRGLPRVLAAGVTLGSPLLFQLVAAAAGSTYTWARYVITAVPLAALWAAPVITDVGRRHGVPTRRAVALVGVAVLTASAFVSVEIQRDRALSSGEEADGLAALGLAATAPADPAEVSVVEAAEPVAADLDDLDAGRGAILTDNATSTLAVVLQAERQGDFVIPSDRDFEAALGAPGSFGVSYALVADPRWGAHDAVVAEHPSIFDDGGGVSTMVAEWGREDQPRGHFRLYRFDGERP